MRVSTGIVASIGLAVMGIATVPAQEKPQKTAIPAAVLEALNAGTREYEAADLEAYSVDLNGDGTPEIAVMGRNGSELCSGAGNCSLWIFGSTADGYVDLVQHPHQRDGDVYDSLATDWKVLDSTHHGYRDLQFFYHDSATVSTTTKYEMRSGKYEYVAGSCETLTYGFFDPEGKFHEYPQPKSKHCDAR